MSTVHAQSVRIVCPEGDVVLRIRRNDDEEILLVSSTALTAASTSFSQILRYSNELVDRQYVPMMELDLTKDDGDAIWTICNIIHDRDDQIPDALPLHPLRSVAVTGIKYGLTELLAARIKRWLIHAHHTNGEKGVRLIPAMAETFRISADFMYKQSELSTDGMESSGKKLSITPSVKRLTITGGYDVSTMSSMLKAVAALRNASPQIYTVSPKCKKGHFHPWKKQMQSRGLWPIENGVQRYDVQGLLQALKTLEVPALDPNCGCTNFAPDIPKKLQDLVCRALEQDS